MAYMPESAWIYRGLVYNKDITTKKRIKNIMTLQQIFEKFKTLKTSSDKLVFLDELKVMTQNNIINFDINFKNIEENIMNER